MIPMRYRLDFYDMIDGWCGGTLDDPNEFDDLNQAMALRDKRNAGLDEANKRAGEHYGVIDLPNGTEVDCPVEMVNWGLGGKPMKHHVDIPKTFAGMAESAIFLLLGTASYLQEIREQGDCYQQVRMARALKKPTLLILDRGLQPSEQEEIRNCLDGLEIIGTVFFDSPNMEERVKDDLGEVLERWKK